LLQNEDFTILQKINSLRLNTITERAPILSPQKISKLVKSHDYQPLEVMQEDLKRSLRGLMTNIAEKVDCIHKKEKKVSLIMDTVREQCRGMRKAIETQKNQQVVLLSCIVLL